MNARPVQMGRGRVAAISARRQRARGLTLIELLAVLGVIAFVSAILLVAIGRGVLSGRAAAEKQMANTMKVACEQFKQQFGFLPPLVSPPVMGTAFPEPLIAATPSGFKPGLFDLAAAARATMPTPNQWYSVYTLPMYLGGAWDADVDGLDGPGMTSALDGAGELQGLFSKRGKTIEPLVDFAKDRRRLFRGDWRPVVPIAAASPTSTTPSWNWVTVQDRWTRAFRYYRWEPTFVTAGAGVDKSLIGTVRNFNVPSVVRTTLNKGVDLTEADALTRFPELRGSGFAIVSSGPDGKFSDDTNPATPAFDADNIMEVGR
jgi:type II secretory pathway pseudopilin PulG